MKFHTDENVAEAVALGLRRRGFDVSTTVETGLRGASDEQQLAHAVAESRVIITHDADMLRLAAGGAPHAGVAYCHVQKYKPGQLLQRILALAGRVPADEMPGRIEFL